MFTAIPTLTGLYQLVTGTASTVETGEGEPEVEEEVFYTLTSNNSNSRALLERVAEGLQLPRRLKQIEVAVEFLLELDLTKPLANQVQKIVSLCFETSEGESGDNVCFHSNTFWGMLV
jgi:hypothetical protein